MTSAKRFEILLTIGASTWSAVSVRVEEGMSELGGAWIELALGEDLDLGDMAEEPATLLITWEGWEKRRFTMHLASARFLDERDGRLRYELELRPHLWFLGLDKNTRKFRDQRTEPIVSKILGERGVKHEWRTRRKSESRPYTVQYRETSLDFVLRLLEYEGFYYSFDPDGTMVIGDTSSSCPEVDEATLYTVIGAESALAHGDFGVTSFERGAAVGSGKATVNDYNWKTPRLPLLKSKTGKRDTFLEVYDYPTGYRKPDIGAVLAQLRLEALEAQKRFVEGTGTVPGFAPARLFELAHEEAMSFSGKYLLVHVEHAYKDEQGAGTYENTFRAIPESVPFRPPLVTPRPVIEGNHTAMVRGPMGEEIHTDMYGRAKVQFHWDREAKGTDEDSRWIRAAQEISTSIALARVGWEMSVGYIDGDPERPVGYARQINGQMTPMYSQPAFRNRMTIRTETYPGKQGFNELRMEDSAGSMTMDWHAQKDLKNLVLNDHTETIGANQTVQIGAESSRVVEKNQTYDIGGNQTRKVGRDRIIKVDQDRTHEIGGNETITITASSDTSVNGDDTEDVGGSRITQAGNDESGSIDRHVQEYFTRIVSGSHISMADVSIQHHGGDKLTETVTGDKLTVATEQNIKESVKGKLDVKVTGDVLRISKDDMSVSAKETTVTVNDSVLAGSAERVELRSKEIEVTASASLTLQAGGLLIEMTPGEVKITGPIKEKSGTKIVVRGNPEKLTP
jgi:type VI secretion system secreted protein VgrG